MPCSQLQTALDIAVLHGNASGFNISILPAAMDAVAAGIGRCNPWCCVLTIVIDSGCQQLLSRQHVLRPRGRQRLCGLCCHCSAELRQLLRHCQPSWGPWSVTWTQIHSWSATWMITTRGSPLQETTGAQRSEGPHPALGQSLTLRLRRL